MPLLTSTLNTELTRILDKDSPSFIGFPADTAIAAQNWANAIDAYAALTVPVSTTAAAAKTAFIAAFQPLLQVPNGGLQAFPLALSAYALTLAGGMAGAGFLGTPPPVPIDLSPAFAVGTAGGNGSAVASAMSTIIDVWFRTGFATPLVGGPPILWS